MGQIEPAIVANLIQDYLNHPEKLTKIRQALKEVRGQSGAAQKLATMARELLT